MKYERLTEVIGSRIKIKAEDQHISRAINRLVDLEDKIENGTLVELPCIRKINTEIAKYEVVYRY